MYNETSKNKVKTFTNHVLNNTWVKVGIIIAGTLLFIYLLGFAFNIVAHTVIGYNKMQYAIGGQVGASIAR